MANKLKITVVNKKSTKDIYGSGDKFPARMTDSFVEECPLFKLGDEFVVQDIVSCPTGFCAWAFADIQRDVTHLLLGGNHPWLQDKGTAIACCTDGLRPVFFKLERIE